MGLGEVVGDRLCAGVMTLGLELSAQRHDRLHELARRFVLAGVRAP